MRENTPPTSDESENDRTSRRNLLGAAAVAGSGLLAGCLDGSSSETEEQNTPPQSEDETPQSTDENRVLIVFFSRTENTQAVAEMIREEVGGELFEVLPAEPYPVDYDTLVSQVDEENEAGYTPPLQCLVEDIGAYDTVFFGAPTWDMQLPPPMKTFLREHDLGGKNVVPFNTNGGYGVGSSFQTIEDRCPNADVREGFSTRGGLERDGVYLAIKEDRREEVRAEVTDWLQRIRI
ncbi:flavodoxin [Haloferax massiliensis]|uniref:Flavodoxin n=1 Tax=Haloferax massiliensis TaxID=1476858 RepID=A0A0D6JPD7_9EURY|nr:flavodoxin [Haloferax massiliensis]